MNRLLAQITKHTETLQDKQTGTNEIQKESGIRFASTRYVFENFQQLIFSSIWFLVLLAVAFPVAGEAAMVHTVTDYCVSAASDMFGRKIKCPRELQREFAQRKISKTTF